MLYMLEVYLLFTIPILMLAGTVLLAMLVWMQAKHYLGVAMQRIGRVRSSAARTPVESFRVA
jgi:hypothetical protein